MTSVSNFVGTTSPLARVTRVNGIMIVSTVSSRDRLIEIDPPRATTTTQRFARGIWAHRQHTGTVPVPDLTDAALRLFAASTDVPPLAEACAERWRDYVPLIGPEFEIRDRAHDLSPRGIVYVTPTETLYDELLRATPGSTLVTVEDCPPYQLSGPGAKLFPGRGTAFQFADAYYAVHVFGGTDDAMIRITETDPRTRNCRRVEWPLLDQEYHAMSRMERCLAGIRQATTWIAVERKIEERDVLAATDDAAATEIAYVRDVNGKEMAFFAFEEGHLVCTNGIIVSDVYPDGRVPLRSWNEAIAWIDLNILAGRVLVRRDTNATALSVATEAGPVPFVIGRDGYGIPEVVPPGPITLPQWPAITLITAALEATGARGGTKEIPTALQAHVALPFQHKDGTFTAAPLVSVLRQWRTDLPLLRQLIPAEPSRYVFIKDLHDAVFAALDAANLDDTSPLGVAKVYGNILAAFYRHHGAKYAALNVSPVCCHVLKQLSAESSEVDAWLRTEHPELEGQTSETRTLAGILPALKDQPTVEIRLSDTLVTETGLFSAWLNETMLQFFFGWTLRAIAAAR